MLEIDLIVADAARTEPAVAIAEHRGSFHMQQVHVHPCVHADGTKILHTADPQGYGQANIVDVPAWDALPDPPAR